MTNILTIISVASGGALGATARLLVTEFVNKHSSYQIPLGTLSVNIVGSFVMGLLFAYFYLNASLSVNIKAFLTTGVLGALTTYSTFAMESFLLINSQEYMSAFANMALNLFGTILFAGMGYILMMHISK